MQLKLGTLKHILRESIFEHDADSAPPVHDLDSPTQIDSAELTSILSTASEGDEFVLFDEDVGFVVRCTFGSIDPADKPEKTGFEGHEDESLSESGADFDVYELVDLDSHASLSGLADRRLAQHLSAVEVADEYHCENIQSADAFADAREQGQEFGRDYSNF